MPSGKTWYGANTDILDSSNLNAPCGYQYRVKTLHVQSEGAQVQPREGIPRQEAEDSPSDGEIGGQVSERGSLVTPYSPR